LDKYLVEKIKDCSRARLQNLIRAGLVMVNEEQIYKSGYKLTRNEEIVIVIPPPEPVDLIPEKITLDIIFENDDLVVVNKPAGMVVHPSIGHDHGTLVHAILAHVPELAGIGGKRRPGIVHRLDKGTSGLILIAKNDMSHHWLQDQFRHRKVMKIYSALVDGQPPTPSGRIEASIGRDPSHRKRMAVLPAGKGREAFTEYFTAENFQKHTLLNVHLLTGRTHQIRLHLSFLKCPIVGDTLYGLRHPTIPIKRNFLHAAKLSILLPGDSKPSSFEAPLPPELRDILLELGSKYR
jgi:23S rRNA pseudouridine1911/1915/1917 synthase